MRIEPGDKVKDVITGLTGIVVSRTEWLNRCVRIQVQPQHHKDGRPADTVPFDEEQLELVKKAAVKIAAKPEQTGGDRPDVKRAPDPTR